MDSIASATAIVVSLSGGKDSVACLIWTRLHFPDMPTLCHHQAMPEDWAETIPYCRQVCRELDVPLVVEQAIYRRELETFQDSRQVWRRRIHVVDLHDRDLPYTRVDSLRLQAVDEDALCGMLDLAHDQGWPPTNRTRWCTAYFKTELYNRWIRAHRGLPSSHSGQTPLTGMLDYAADRGTPPTARLRWCTDKFKTKVFDQAVRRNRHLLGAAPVTLLGFRHAESPRRARLPSWRERTAVQLKPGNKDWPEGWHMVDHHPIIDWSRRQTFRFLRDHGIEPHPAYAWQGMTPHDMYDLDKEGGPRCSCINCIFAHPDHLIAAARHPHCRAVLERTLAFEKATGLTWQQGRSLTSILNGPNQKTKGTTTMENAHEEIPEFEPNCAHLPGKEC